MAILLILVAVCVIIIVIIKRRNKERNKNINKEEVEDQNKSIPPMNNPVYQGEWGWVAYSFIWLYYHYILARISFDQLKLFAQCI